ncbi:MAG TPA: rod-binding protein [Polyangiaceae bacterium]|nr:rod-binding protein [Polyangiaceae bacterium]
MTSPISALNALHGAAAAQPAEQVDPKALKAAKDFETIFLRTLLHSLEKTTSIKGSGKLDTGQSTYGSMVVGAMAEQVSQSGGIGLADIVAKSLTTHGPAGATEPKLPK